MSSITVKITEELSLFAACFNDSFAILFPETGVYCQPNHSQIPLKILDQIATDEQIDSSIVQHTIRILKGSNGKERWIVVAVGENTVPAEEPVRYLSHLVERIIQAESKQCPVVRSDSISHCPSFSSVTGSALNVLSREIPSGSIAYLSVTKEHIDDVKFSDQSKESLHHALSSKQCIESLQNMITAEKTEIAVKGYVIPIENSTEQIIGFPHFHDNRVIGIIAVLSMKTSFPIEYYDKVEPILTILTDLYLLIHEKKSAQWVADSAEELKWNRIKKETSLGLGRWELNILSNSFSFDKRTREILHLHGIPEKISLEQLTHNHSDLANLITSLVEKTVCQDSGKEWQDSICEIEISGKIHFLRSYSMIHRDTQGTHYKLTGLFSDITEIRAQALDYESKNELLQGILDIIPAAVSWRDRTGKILGCNKNTARILGYNSPEEICGKTIYEVVPYRDAQITVEDDAAVIASGVPYMNTIRKALSQDRWFYISKAPLIDRHSEITGVISSYYDITDLKQANDNYHNSETRFSTIFNLSPIGLALISYDGMIIDCNQALSLILKQNKEELIHSSLLSFATPESFDIIAELINRITLYFDRTFHQSIYLYTKAGDTILVDINLRNVGYLPGTGEVFAITVEDITEQRKLFDDLKNQEIELRHMIDLTYDGEIWLNPDRSFRIISQSMERITGYSRDELMAKPETLVSMITEGSRQKQIDTLDALFARNSLDPILVQLHYRNAHGQTAWLEQLGQSVFDENGIFLGVRLSIRDVTEQRKLTQKIEENIHQFTLFSSSVAEVFALVNLTTFAIRLVQKEPFEQMFQLPVEITHDGVRFLETILTSETIATLSHLIEEFRNGELDQVAFVQEIIDGSGKERFIEIQIRSAVKNKNTTEEISIVAKNVTMDVQLKKQERERHEQLRQADKMISLGILSAGVAHEINNPNNLIGLNAEFLLQMWDDIEPILQEYARVHPDFTVNRLPYSMISGEFPRMLNGIQRGSNRIMKIVDGMKSFSRSEDVTMNEQIDLNTIIHDSMLIVGHTVSKLTNNLVIELADELPYIKGNSQQVEQVFINLITNASQALTDRNQRIHISTGVAGDWVYMTVDDDGRGMDHDTIDKMKIPFFTTRRDSGGTGLGMSVTHEILQAHKAQMDIHSTPGRGTMITVMFPGINAKGTDE